MTEEKDPKQNTKEARGAEPRKDPIAKPLKPKSDRRRHSRYEHKLIVKYRCVSSEWTTESDLQVGLIEDFSASGVTLKTKRAYSTGTILEIKFPNSPPFPNKTLNAEVVWLFRPPEAEQYNLGCKFVKPKA